MLRGLAGSPRTLGVGSAAALVVIALLGPMTSNPMGGPGNDPAGPPSAVPFHPQPAPGHDLVGSPAVGESPPAGAATGSPASGRSGQHVQAGHLAQAGQAGQPPPTSPSTTAALTFPAAMPRPSGTLAWLSEPYTGHLVVASGDTSFPVAITADGVTDFAWSPDGSRIAYIRYEPGSGNGLSSHYELRLIWRDGSADRLVRRSTPGFFTGGVDWSPDGQHVVVYEGISSGVDCKVDLLVVEINTAETEALTRGGCDFQPDWSPDGSRVVFARLAGLDISIWIVALDSLVATPLTGFFEAPFPLGDVDIGPVWAPDGSRIAYERGFTVATIRPDGTDYREVAPESHDRWLLTPAWAPDSSRLAVTNWGDHEALLTMGYDGRDATVIAEGAYFYPAFSPDGQWIAASSGREGTGPSVFAADGTRRFVAEVAGLLPAFAPR